MAKLGVEIATELKLGLPGSSEKVVNEKKRVFSEVEGGDGDSSTASGGGGGERGGGNKSQVVGWPPVCSYRRKNIETASSNKGYVKVSMDGAPFLRKIDLGMLCGYSDLAKAMEKLFGCFGIDEAMKDGENCSELMPIYEDKDGDWMLVGDVPWQMFVETCKRLRIMKKSEAKGFGLQLKGASKDHE